MRGLFRSSTIQTISVYSGFLCRNLNTSRCCLAVDKGLLSKLRKQTGIPFINCKKALEQFDNDFEQAKKWLQEQAQKEGWARATKLQTRPMSQGLVALLSNDKQATLLEVNCETDFVARNDKFVSMVTQLVQDCNSYLTKQDKYKVNLSREELGHILSSEQTTLADIVALKVGNVGENMALRRAAFLRASSDSVLCSYTHPSSSSSQKTESHQLGKYGAIVELCRVNTSSSDTSFDIQELGSHLCQHIVGMNPKVIGEFSPESSKSNKKGPTPSKESASVTGDGIEGGEEQENLTQAEQEDEDNDELLSQEFLLDSSVTVGELLHSSGVRVRDFVRFACGEELEGEKE